MTALIFLIAALATHRLSLAITEEEGPGWPFGTKEQRKSGMFLRLRGAIDPDQKTWIGRGLNCIFCVGFWVALPMAVWLGVLGLVDPYVTPLVWWGLAGSVVVIRRWEQKK